MRQTLLLTVAVLSLGGVTAQAAEPITRADIDAIVKEGMQPDILNSMQKSEIYTRKYSAPTMKMRLINEIIIPGNPPQKTDRTFNSLEEFISGGKKGAVNDKVFTQTPTASVDVTSFSYDETTTKAKMGYTTHVQGPLVAIPTMKAKIDQACTAILARNTENVIQSYAQICNQRMTLSPL